jgi:putative transposase
MSDLLRRKMTLRCYISRKQAAVLENNREWHRLLYNAALQERIDAWQKCRKSITYNEQQNILPQLKKDMPELVSLGSQALQETLRRVDRAFQAFYRRCAAGETPGFPRFKSYQRFDSFTYPSPAGWSYIPLQNSVAKDGTQSKYERKGILRVGDLMLRVRGMSRFDAFEANDLTLKRVRKAHGKKLAVWEASITLRVSEADCARERTGHDIRAFDQGLTDRLVFDNGEKVQNTRLLRNRLDELAELQQERSRCTKGSRQYQRLSAELTKIHRAIANQRKDELHKLSTEMVTQCELLATEALDVDRMVERPEPIPELDANGVKTGHFLPNGSADKAPLNRENLSAGYGFLLQLFSYKAAEAGTRLHVANTKKLKPTQRCAQCGTLNKKQLSDRTHLCVECGFCTTRDRNAALVCLIDAIWPTFYESAQKKQRFFEVDGYASFLRNRILYAAVEPPHVRTLEPAHGIGVVTEETLETPA